MKCQYCGEELSGGRFCTNCGKPVPETPAGFQTEQQIPEPTMRQIPTPVQQVPEPTEWILAPTQQTPPQPVPPTQPTGQGAPGKKTLKPGVIIAIVLGLLLVVVLAIVLTRGTSGSAVDPEEQTRQLTQYAKSKAWIEDCDSQQKKDWEYRYNSERVQYYLYDYNNDGQLELIVTLYNSGGDDAQCLVYGFADGQVQPLASHTYKAGDSGLDIVGMRLAGRDNYFGFAVYFTVDGGGEYPYLGVLQLEDNTLTEIDAVAGADECAAYMSSNGWELLDGTAITELDGNLISDLTAEELASLTELYDPDKPEQEMNFMLLGETVYSVEVSGLYRFAGQQKQTVCTAPEGAAFEFAAGYAPYDGCIYLLATVDQSDETQETVVMRADTRTGALETLFPVERGENILKADGQYIYVQTRSASKALMGQVVAYDYSGSAVKAFATPWRWSADGVTVSGEDVEGNRSIITADGQYLLENVAAQSVQIVDGGVYYLLSTGDSTKLYYSGLDADAYEVGTIPLGTNAYLTQRDGQLMVVVPENETTVANYSVPGLEYIDSTRGNQVPSYSLPDPDWEPLSWTITDTATGVEYVVTHMAPHGNCGPLYRLKEDGQVELVVQEPDQQIYYLLAYDNVIYYAFVDYSETQFYMQAPMVSGCMPVE